MFSRSLKRKGNIPTRDKPPMIPVEAYMQAWAPVEEFEEYIAGRRVLLPTSPVEGEDQRESNRPRLDHLRGLKNKTAAIDRAIARMELAEE